MAVAAGVSVGTGDATCVAASVGTACVLKAEPRSGARWNQFGWEMKGEGVIYICFIEVY